MDKSNKTSVPGADDTSGPSEVTVLSATAPLTEPLSSVTTQQVLVEDLTVLPVVSSAPSSSSKSSSTSPDVGQTREMINSLFPGGEIVHTAPKTNAAIRKRKEGKSLTMPGSFDAIYVTIQQRGCGGCFSYKRKVCSVRSSDFTGKSKHNKTASYGMESAVRFQTSALNEHCSGQKHQDSIAAEMLRTSIFQEKLD